jgi:hypothetical protein
MATGICGAGEGFGCCRGHGSGGTYEYERHDRGTVYSYGRLGYGDGSFRGYGRHFGFDGDGWGWWRLKRWHR